MTRHPSDLLRRDPVAFANRPLEPGFDAYQAVREHVEGRHITLKAGTQKPRDPQAAGLINNQR